MLGEGGGGTCDHLISLKSTGDHLNHQRTMKSQLAQGLLLVGSIFSQIFSFKVIF